MAFTRFSTESTISDANDRVDREWSRGAGNGSEQGGVHRGCGQLAVRKTSREADGTDLEGIA